MTRTARKKTAKAKFLEASSWEELSSRDQDADSSSRETKSLRRVESGRVHKRKQAKKDHKLCLKEDVFQTFVDQMEGEEDDEFEKPSSSNVKLVKHLKKHLVKRNHSKSKQMANSTVDGETEVAMAKISNQDKRKLLKKNLKMRESGLKRTAEIVDEKRSKRREQRRLRRAKKKVCFNCREWGHQLEECPKAKESAGICFKCGSTEHTAKKCTVLLSQGQYPFARCFICDEIGHLSRSCPDNPRGLYPRGGGCRLCGSVEHLRTNCPMQHKHCSSSRVMAKLLSDGKFSADADPSDCTPSDTTPQLIKTKRKPTIIKF